MQKKTGSLKKFNNSAIFSLFLTAYSPMFFIIILKQIFGNIDYLHHVDLSIDSFYCFAEKFGIASISLILILWGLIGLFVLLRRMNNKKNNSYKVKILNIENQNEQFSNYIISYIIPIAFLSSEKLIDSMLILILLFIIYKLYEKSNMCLINPSLSFVGYYLYQIDFQQDSKSHKGIVLIKNNQMEKNDFINIYQIGQNSYFGF